MSATSQKWLLRAAPWFLPVGIVALWQLASSTGWLSSRILPSPEGVVESVLVAERQRRAVAASGDQLTARRDRVFHRRQYRAGSGSGERPFTLGRAAAGYLHPDAAERAASGADPAGHSVVWD